MSKRGTGAAFKGSCLFIVSKGREELARWRDQLLLHSSEPGADRRPPHRSVSATALFIAIAAFAFLVALKV
jgi:hypothetical protein